MRVIDIHAHLCRTPEQERLVFPKKGWPLEWYWANPDRVIPYMDARGISELVTANIMVASAMIGRKLAKLRAGGASDEELRAAEADLKEETKERVRAFNTWACELHKKEPRIIPFALADPVLFEGDEAVAEVDRCVKMGAAGFKMHPNNCQHYPDDPRALGVYDYLSSASLPVLTCSSGRDEPKGHGYGLPSNWRPVFQQFPRIKVILAHFNEGLWDERLELAEEFPDNVWFDISGGLVDDQHPKGSHRELFTDMAPRVYRKVGIERLMFGSDEPASGLDLQDLIWQVIKLDLTDDEKEQILWRNAATADQQQQPK